MLNSHKEKARYSKLRVFISKKDQSNRCVANSRLTGVILMNILTEY